MIMRHIATILSFLALCSCSQSLENTYSNQESKIDSFLASEQKKILDAAPAEGDELYGEYQELLNNGMGEIVYNRNSNRLVLKPGTGEQLGASGKVTVYCAVYVFSGGISASNLVFTNHEETAEQTGWEVTDPVFDPITLDLKDKKMVTGLRNGLEGVKSGEECYIVFSGKYGYGNKVHGKVPANSALLYHIRVLSIR